MIYILGFFFVYSTRKGKEKSPYLSSLYAIWSAANFCFTTLLFLHPFKAHHLLCCLVASLLHQLSLQLIWLWIFLTIHHLLALLHPFGLISWRHVPKLSQASAFSALIL